MLAPVSPPPYPQHLGIDVESNLAERRQTVSKHSNELDIEEEDEVPDDYDADRDGKFAPQKLAEGWEGKWGFIGTAMAFLIRNGCEARGIQPVRVEVSFDFRFLSSSLLPSLTFPSLRPSAC